MTGNYTVEEAELIEQIRTAIQNDEGNPFPYEGCWKLEELLEKDGPGVLDEGLIPDLDVYFADIMGFASDARGIYRWTEERKSLFVNWDKRDFFEQHPGYIFARSYITQDATPDLYRDIVLYDGLREKIVRLYQLHYGLAE